MTTLTEPLRKSYENVTITFTMTIITSISLQHHFNIHLQNPRTGTKSNKAFHFSQNSTHTVLKVSVHHTQNTTGRGRTFSTPATTAVKR